MVRGDSKLNPTIRGARSWQNASYDKEVVAKAGSRLAVSIGQSFSGNERNKLFLNQQAKQFQDLSAISGLDSIADSRVLTLWDFDRDGWQDMAVANANAPLLNIYRNEIGYGREAANPGGGIVAIRFVGGSRSPQAHKRLGCRDGYGTKVLVAAGELKLIREHRCGEGMAGQNSSTMLVGIGRNDSAEITVRWLSGVKQQIRNVAAGTLLTVYEDPTQSPDKSGQERERYILDRFSKGRGADLYSAVADRGTGKRVHYKSVHAAKASKSDKEKVLLFTTMATWCSACKRHLPQLQQLRGKLGPESLAMYSTLR